VFDVRLSIEKDAHARRTLHLRSFYRELDGVTERQEYVRYLRGQIDRDELWGANPEAFRKADRRNWEAELGVIDHLIVRDRIDEALNESKEWVLLGGPPCQAYSVVGRSRMLPVLGREKFDRDPRQQLYREYLRILADHAPAVFIFENVRGLLSSKHKGRFVFPRIIEDLKNPAASVHDFPPPRKEPVYRLFPLTDLQPGNAAGPQPEDFIVRSEEFGVPQARHRVIILGVRTDTLATAEDRIPAVLEPATERVVLEEVIGDLPRLRSSLSRPSGSFSDWINALESLDIPANRFSEDAELDESIADLISDSISAAAASDPGSGGPYVEHTRFPLYNPDDWYRNGRSEGITNHEARRHMISDLHRYLFCACFAEKARRTPHLKDFPFWLLPDHRNARRGTRTALFSDRFRVQVRDRQATTITSHIAKDGHYFIHYDPSQCRALTVREAARIQTFPDDYHFEGPRTQQYAQVGNAVPPLLAYQIAGIVADLLNPADGSSEQEHGA